MREPVLVVGSDLRQLMDIAVAFRGAAYGPTFALCPEVIERASAGTDAPSRPVVVCFNGRETAGQIAEFLACDPLAVLIEPAAGLNAPVRRIVEAFGQVTFEYGVPGLVVLAALIAVARDRSLRAEQEPGNSAAIPFRDNAGSD